MRLFSSDVSDFYTGFPMSVVCFRSRTVIQSRLIPWETGVPGIWFRYADGYEVVTDARVKTPDVLEAISRLSSTDRATLDALLERSNTLPLAREPARLATIFRPNRKWDDSA